MRDQLRDVNGALMGYIDTDSKGNKRAYDYTGRFLGRYDVQFKMSYDAMGKPVARYDCTSVFVANSKK